MERAEALLRIRELTGKDLRPLADHYGLTVWKDGKKTQQPPAKAGGLKLRTESPDTGR